MSVKKKIIVELYPKINITFFRDKKSFVRMHDSLCMNSNFYDTYDFEKNHYAGFSYIGNNGGKDICVWFSKDCIKREKINTILHECFHCLFYQDKPMDFCYPHESEYRYEELSAHTAAKLAIDMPNILCNIEKHIEL